MFKRLVHEHVFHVTLVTRVTHYNGLESVVVRLLEQLFTKFWLFVGQGDKKL